MRRPRRKYYINVQKLMEIYYLPRPKLRSKFVVGDNEILPIILVEAYK